jgi:hypothetical protein
MVSFYPPQSHANIRPNAVHEQQARLKRYYRSLGVSAVAAELDKISREIHNTHARPESPEQFVESLENMAFERSLAA